MTKEVLPMSIDEIADMILEETNEVVNHYYISELSSDIPEKYRHIKSAVFSSILRCVDEIYRNTDPEGIPTDKIYAKVGEKIWTKSEFTSPEFTRGIISAYKDRIEDYDEIHKDEDTENSKIRNTINWLGKDELRIAIARSQGIEVVCEEWPCEYGVDRTGIDAAIDVRKNDEGKWIPVDGLEVNRDFDLRYPVTRVYSTGWPPKKSTISFAEEDWMEARVEPIPNSSDDILAAMFLVSDLKQQGPETQSGLWPEGFKFVIRESVTDGMYKCIFSRKVPYKVTEIGKAASVSEAICRAYLMVMLIHLNPEIRSKVIDLDEEE